MENNLVKLEPCPFCSCRDRRVGIRRMGNNGYRVCCSKCGSLGPHVSVKDWNGHKKLAQKEASCDVSYEPHGKESDLSY